MVNNKIYVAGHLGMVGASLLRTLKKNGENNIITKSHAELDLTNQSQVQEFFKDERPNEVYLAAARVGGIFANNRYPGEFIYQNLMIQTNVIHNAFVCGVKKILFLGSSCIYPKHSQQPIKEEYLLTGKLEETNEPYAIAKIAGIKMCESYNRQYGKSHNIDYRCIMPTNLYGVGDNYDQKNSHVIPSLIRRFHIAKISGLSSVTVWGTGDQKRDFLYVDDMTRACIHLMNLEKDIYNKITNPMSCHINVGSGEDITIKDLAHTIKDVVQFNGTIEFDSKQPNGAERKLLDNQLINSIKWKPQVNLEEGIIMAYDDFKKSI
jgi:GDP-L-fucose synthase